MIYWFACASKMCELNWNYMFAAFCMHRVDGQIVHPIKLNDNAKLWKGIDNNRSYFPNSTMVICFEFFVRSVSYFSVRFSKWLWVNWPINYSFLHSNYEKRIQRMCYTALHSHSVCIKWLLRLVSGFSFLFLCVSWSNKLFDHISQYYTISLC